MTSFFVKNWIILHLSWKKTFFVDFDCYITLHRLFVDRDVLIDCSLLDNKERKQLYVLLCI